MSKVAVVYWSGTGNTEQMAESVADGARNAGADVTTFTAAEFDADKMDEFDAIAFGCPSMGAEQLEEDEFEPMFTACETKLSGKKIALFGSYGWGDGEWMRNWVKQMQDAGAEVVGGEDAICCDAPDDEAEEKLVELGKKLAE
ncbi:MAG: flavodoxin [Lachnospiraceae bacterium]